jgi:chemotaxis protein CheX
VINVKFLNPFVEAATEVLKAEVQIEVRRGSLTLQKSALTTDDITVLITLVGQIEGLVLFSLSTETGLAMVAGMMGQPFGEFDSLAQSGIAELGNVIAGRATIKLAEAGIQSNISTPTLILGKNIHVSTLEFQRIVVPLDTDMGSLTVHLALRENPSATVSWSSTPGNLLVGKPG